jgi:REP element-mobilizing transposase RayT
MFSYYIGEIKMRQQEIQFRTWGGKRKDAGRPPKGRRAGAPHKKRPRHDRSHPVHVTLRATAGAGRLRRRDAWQAIRRAAIAMLDRTDFRICHYSIQGNHIHLIVEAEDAKALARGMQGFQISGARRINAAITRRTGRRRRGQVFADRYHPEYLTTPLQVKNALCYVMNNWRKHGEARPASGAVDPYSSGKGFDGWDRPVDRSIRPDEEFIPVLFPDTWLLSKGWRRHGAISPWAVPGVRRD